MSRRVCAALLACLVVVLGSTLPASGDEILDHARRQREAANSHLETRRERLRALRRDTRKLGAGVRAEWAQGENQWRMTALIRQHEALREAIAHQRRLIRRLVRRKANLAVLIDRLAPLKVCPVRGVTGISDDFGVMRYHPPQPHLHMGNDIGAAYWAPILAPFDGRAVAETSELGGLGVKVYGADGYVYNGHLAALGRLGYVSAGTVIGYVGTSGNATGPHDHFEWHPWNGPAVDPHTYLLRAC